MKAIKYLLTLVAVTGIANAATISVNFMYESASETIAAGTSVGLSGYAAANWNNVLGDTLGRLEGVTQGSLKNNAGTATTASATWSSGSPWGDSSANTAATSGNGNAQMRRGYLSANSPTSLDVTGIEYAQYTLVLYYSIAWDDRTAGAVTVNGVNYAASTA